MSTFGIQPYLSPDTPPGASTLAEVVRALAKPITAAGLATEAELDVDTLKQRIDSALRDAHAVLVAPTLVGAWGRASRLADRAPGSGTERGLLGRDHEGHDATRFAACCAGCGRAEAEAPSPCARPATF